jgi:predicted porin
MSIFLVFPSFGADFVLFLSNSINQSLYCMHNIVLYLGVITNMNALKKSALLIALAAAAVGAQAAEVYGTADLGYSYSKLDGVERHGVDSSGKSDSFIGFRAAEDLGSGLKASVTLEAGYNLDTGATSTNLFNREASIGLTSGAHTIKAGRILSQGYAATKQFDVFGGGNLGMARAVSNVAEYQDNAIGYTFALGDVKAGVQHSFGEQLDGSLTDGSTTSLAVSYARGPLTGSLVHTDVDGGARTLQVGAGYDFGVASASLLVQDAKDSALERSFLVGVKAPVAGFVAKASLGQAKLFTGEKVDLYAVGGEYNLSKRTSVYASYGRVEATALDGDQFAVGVNHSF